MTARGIGRRASWLAVAAAVALGVSGCAATVDGTPHSLASAGSGAGGAATSTQQAVLDAAASTMAQHTADISLRMSMSAAGQTISMTGSGQVDFVHHGMSMTIDASVEGHSMVVHELIVGGNLDMSVDVDGQSLAGMLGTGKQWLQIGAPGMATSSTSDPLNSFALLGQKGGSVRALGSSTIDGVVMEGYAVTPSGAEITAQAQKALAGLPVSAAAKAAALKQAEALAAHPPTIDVWIDGQHLVRRTNMDMSGLFAGLGSALGGGSSGISGGAATVDYSNYGTAVHIVAPPASEVAPFAQALQGGSH